MARMKDVDVDFISLVSKGANGQKVQIYKADEEPVTHDDEMAGFFSAMKSFFSKKDVSKAEKDVKSFKDRMSAKEVMENMWRVNDTLVSVMRDVLGSASIKDKETAINTAIDEHGAYLKAKIKGIDDVKKADFLNNEGGMEDMEIEDLKEIIKEAVEPISAKVEAIEKSMEVQEPTKQEPEPKEDNIAKEDIAKAVKEAIEPLNSRIEKIESFKGVSKQLEDDNEPIKKESTSVFAGINI